MIAVETPERTVDIRSDVGQDKMLSAAEVKIVDAAEDVGSYTEAAGPLTEQRTLTAHDMTLLYGVRI